MKNQKKGSIGFEMLIKYCFITYILGTFFIWLKQNAMDGLTVFDKIHFLSPEKLGKAGILSQNKHNKDCTNKITKNLPCITFLKNGTFQLQ